MKGSASVPLIIRRNSLYVYARFVDCVSLEGKNGYVEESDSVIVAPLAYGGASGSNEPAAAVPAAEPLAPEPAPAAVLDVVLPATGVDLAFDVPAFLGSQPLHPHSRVEDLRARLRQFYVPVYGTKATLWARLQVEEKERLKNDGVQAELERRERELSEGVVVVRPGPLMIPGVVMPTAQEIASREITHLPPKPWCESCQRGRANDKPHAKLGEDSLLGQHADYSY